MKTLFLTIALMTSMVPALLATPVSFTCYPLDENGFPETLVRLDMSGVKNAKLTLVNSETKKPEGYATYALDPSYTSDSPSMAKFSEYVPKSIHTAMYSGEMPVIYLEKELARGGYKLRNGKMGGIFKFSGWGYSWAKYMCMR